VKILLDTCTFLWITLDASELSMNARKIFREPDNRIYLSSVSAWEIAVKYALGKLPLPEKPSVFVSEQRELHYIESLPLYERASLRSDELPQLHRDPFDRMLICQAIEDDLILLTPDPMIRQYSVKTAW
jgi:PIN domain nuclease of toxin-antitoxin system